MEFLLWGIVALLAYSFVAPLTSIATEEVPPAAGLFLATIIFLVIASGVIHLTGTPVLRYLFTVEAGYIYIAGVFLTIGILAYTAALQAGPVSIVVPIFGMFFVGSALLGIVFLGESPSLSSVVGIGCAVFAIYLGAGEAG